jgi:TRAP-type C4-dicarboxylate transport system permease large subunit
MLVALGGHFLYREISKGNWIFVVALVAVVVLVRFWPQIVAWIEQRRRPG